MDDSIETDLAAIRTLTQSAIPAPDASIPDLVDQATELVRAVCPSLHSAPIYVALSSDLPRIEFANNCHAFVTCDLDLLLRPYRDDWQGRGLAVVIDDRHLTYSRASDTIMVLLRLLAHELTHCLVDPRLFDGRRSPVRALDTSLAQRFAPLAVAAASSPVIRLSPRASATEPTDRHGLQFHRALGHVWHRLQRHFEGTYIGPPLMGAVYGLSSGATYLAAMADELDNKRAWTIGDVLLSDPPRDLLTLWAADHE